jgi:non-specific serine/threonine protein kinase
MPSAAPPSAAARLPVTRAFGRFELRELLGRSQRTMLWLALDARVGQEMLLTLPRVAPADAAALESWLAEARQGARLSHPNIAPAVEAGVHENWPYIACDRALGLTLAEYLATHPTPGHNELAGWLCQALAGLAFAHEAGVAHHDLQLHSVLVDERGQVRLMALAAASAEAAVALKSSAPAQAMPKVMPVDTARLQAHRAAAERDVLSVGILAYQWLAGAPALDERDVGRVIERIAPLGREQLRLPWTVPQPISDALRAIVNRATHSQPRQRYLSARTLLHALEGWREADAKETGGPIALLLDRLSSVGHLPAMPGVAATLLRLSSMERQRTIEIAQQVLGDFALSFEMMRLVNSAQVRGTQVSGNGPVLTIRRAIAMLGLDGVRQAATALRPWPGPLSQAGSEALRALLGRVRLAGYVGQLLRPPGYDPEVVFLLAVLQNLGRLMVQYHFSDDAEQIWQLMRPLPPATPDLPEQPGMSEQAAAYAVLGTDIETLGMAVARHWGLTEDVLHMMRRLPTESPVRSADNDGDLLRATASAANEAVDAITRNPPTRVHQAIENVAKRYGRLLGVTSRELQDALRDARHALDTGASPLAAAGEGAGDSVRDSPDAPASEELRGLAGVASGAPSRTSSKDR